MKLVDLKEVLTEAGVPIADFAEQQRQAARSSPLNRPPRRPPSRPSPAASVSSVRYRLLLRRRTHGADRALLDLRYGVHRESS